MVCFKVLVVLGVVVYEGTEGWKKGLGPDYTV